MIDLTDMGEVIGLQSNIRASLDSDSGKEVMKFLEEICGWYSFYETDTNTVLIQHGKRQILATLKTLLKLAPAEIVALAQKEK